MNNLDFLLGILLAIVGLAALLWLLWLPLSQFRFLFGGSLSRLRITKAVRRLKLSDELLEAERYAEALRELQSAVLFDFHFNSRSIAEMKDHHQNILSRCLIVAEHLGGQLTNIAEVERLILERAELQLLYLRTDEAFQSVSRRRTTSGKELPAWSRADFSRRLDEVKQELGRNREQLRTEFLRLFQSAGTSTATDVTYH